MASASRSASVKSSLTLRRCARQPALSTVKKPKPNLALAPAQAVTTYALKQMLPLQLACISFVASGAVVLV